MTHDIYFGNLHEDTVGEAYLYLPNKVGVSLSLLSPVAPLSQGKIERRAAAAARSRPGHRLAGRAERGGFPGEDGEAEEAARPANAEDGRAAADRARSGLSEAGDRHAGALVAGELHRAAREERVRRPLPPEEAEPAGAEPGLPDPSEPAVPRAVRAAEPNGAGAVFLVDQGGPERVVPAGRSGQAGAGQSVGAAAVREPAPHDGPGRAEERVQGAGEWGSARRVRRRARLR